MKQSLTLAAIIEVATGMALLIVPSLVGRLLFGEELTGIVISVGRVLGIALIALGVCCWPGSTALCGMLTYSGLVTLYLLYLAIRGEWVGAPLVAGSRVTWDSDRASRPCLASIAKPDQ